MSSQVQTQTKAYDWMPSAAATLQLVQKRSLVSVQLDDGASVEGVLLTVDPCSGDVFLLHPNSQLKQASGGGESSESSSSSSKCALSVVLGHTVRSLAPSSSSASSSGRRKGGDAEQQVERFLKWIASATAAAEAGGGDSRASDWDASKVPDLEARLQHLLALLTRHRIPHTVLTSGQVSECENERVAKINLNFVALYLLCNLITHNSTTRRTQVTAIASTLAAGVALGRLCRCWRCSVCGRRSPRPRACRATRWSSAASRPCSLQTRSLLLLRLMPIISCC